MKTAPHISINKLIEYCYARSTRRTAIIEDIIKPKNFLIDTGYNDIERAIMHFASGKGNDCSRLDQLDALFLKRVATTSHEELRLLTAHDAIELARRMNFEHFAEGTSLTRFEAKLPKFDIGGVSVSVNPTNLVSRSVLGRKDRELGLFKPYLSKTIPLNKETGALMGALLHWYLEEELAISGTAKSEICIVYDIFAKKAFFAPPAFQQRRKLIQAACVEISDRWDSIEGRLEKSAEAKRKGAS